MSKSKTNDEEIAHLDNLIAETKEQIEMLRVDIGLMKRSYSVWLREDLIIVKEYLKRLQKKKKAVAKGGKR